MRDFDKNNLKAGVPTMGGLIIIIAILIPCLLVGRLNNVYMLLLLITTVWLGILGFADDYIKTFKKNKDGIPGKIKIIAQVGLGLVIGITLYLSPQAVMRENITVEKTNNIEEVYHKNTPEKLNKTTIPFIKNHNLDYSEIMYFCGEYKDIAGWIEIEGTNINYPLIETFNKQHINILSLDSTGPMKRNRADHGIIEINNINEEYIFDILCNCDLAVIKSIADSIEYPYRIDELKEIEFLKKFSKKITNDVRPSSTTSFLTDEEILEIANRNVKNMISKITL